MAREYLRIVIRVYARACRVAYMYAHDIGCLIMYIYKISHDIFIKFHMIYLIHLHVFGSTLYLDFKIIDSNFRNIKIFMNKFIYLCFSVYTIKIVYTIKMQILDSFVIV
jgi:hypothetical protein